MCLSHPCFGILLLIKYGQFTISLNRSEPDLSVRKGSSTRPVAPCFLVQWLVIEWFKRFRFMSQLWFGAGS